MARNYLKGRIVDEINALMASCGYYLKNLLNHMRAFVYILLCIKNPQKRGYSADYWTSMISYNQKNRFSVSTIYNFPGLQNYRHTLHLFQPWNPYCYQKHVIITIDGLLRQNMGLMREGLSLLEGVNGMSKDRKQSSEAKRKRRDLSRLALNLVSWLDLLLRMLRSGSKSASSLTT